MKKALFTGVLCSLLVVATPGVDLRFTSGSVSAYTNVTLNLSGPNGMTVQVQRLNRTNDTWESHGSLTLNSTNGMGTLSATLIENVYGFYRATGTNSGARLESTNGFGAVVGAVNQGYTLVGNLFGTLSTTNIIRDPVVNTMVQQWNNSSNAFYTSTFDEFDLAWEPAPPSLGTAEGFFIYNPGTNGLKYVVSGLFDTNAISKTIPAGLSILASPLYHITATNTWRVDTLDTNHLGGTENLPVQTTGQNPQATIYQQITTTPTYNTNNLTSGNLWQRSGTNVVINLGITEGFWLNKPGTNSATWTIQRALW